MGRMITPTLLSLAFLLVPINGYTNPNCENDKQVIVHLFEWKWEDIARECEDFLGPARFCGVQISPPHEHIIYDGIVHPWWERYQPVSYKIINRSGNEAQFRDMVQRCKNVGVNIYVDLLANHMAMIGESGYGTGGSFFDASAHDFGGVPYNRSDFTPRENCTTNSGNIENYGDINQVRYCNLNGLTDLWGKSPSVQDKIAAYMNKLVKYGVAGFRVDAAKHMWPNDLAQIQSKTNDLNVTFGFPTGSKPFFFHEVIDHGGEPIKVQDYYSLGKVTEFRYGPKIKAGIYDFSNLPYLYSSGMADFDHALVFVDNHDNQRGHGGGSDVLTHTDAHRYKLATAFTLAQHYGFIRLMSSYRFVNSDIGPPMNADQSIKNVIIDSQNRYCVNDVTDWVCEHRWDAIFRMVQFRNAVIGTGITCYECANNFCSICRGGKGFFAMAHVTTQNYYQTGMPAGTYQEIMTGNDVTVHADGRVEVTITDLDIPVFAICVGCQYLDLTNNPPITDGIHRTVVLIYKVTYYGQDLFIRGGNAIGNSIDISGNSLGTDQHYDKYNAWRIGDTQLDWLGAEASQGTYNGDPAKGTPLAWTTNDPTNSAYQNLNTYGEHYWMVDFDMDCSETSDGWFELKGYFQGNWENDINQGTCSGTAGAPKPFSSQNHIAKCGYTNVFSYSGDNCIIESL